MSGVRFAPSPTGDFHIGNLRTAWVSYEWSRRLGVPWVVRFEDIDTPRVVVGSQDKQLRDLKTLGLEPDQIHTQSQNGRRHFTLLEAAVKANQVYPCTCSRKEVVEALATMASAPHKEPPLYTGHCRNGVSKTDSPTSVAWRWRQADTSGHGDFIVARTQKLELDFKSFTPAYHWACAVDDFDGAYNLLVRAWDLAPAAAAQRAIQIWLKDSSARGAVPEIFHCALVVQDDGHRLEKRTRGVTLAELQSLGVSASQLKALFARSYEVNTNFNVELNLRDLRGEAARQIKLGALLAAK